MSSSLDVKWTKLQVGRSQATAFGLPSRASLALLAVALAHAFMPLHLTFG